MCVFERVAMRYIILFALASFLFAQEPEVIRIGPDNQIHTGEQKKKKTWDKLDELDVDEIKDVQEPKSADDELIRRKSTQTAYSIDDNFKSMLTQCISGDKSACSSALAFADKNSTQCNLNSTEVCRAYASIFLIHNQRQKALNARQIACNGDNATACFEAWKLYESGKGIKKNPKQGFGLLTKSCDFKNADACYQLAGYYRNGIGAELNLKKAKELYSKSCDLGNSDACDAYNEFL